MTSLTDILSEHLGTVFAARGLPAELGRVRVSDRPDLAQFQCNGAMAAARLAGRNPRDIAQDIVEILSGSDIFAKIDIAGPGFINLTLTESYLAAHLADMAADSAHEAIPQSGNGASVILDYGGPNIAKPMHVGHLRAAIIGDSIRRIMDAAGFHTLGDVHMGDWGTHLGMLIADYLREGEEDLILQADVSDPAAVARMMEDMAVRYPRASGACKSDPELMAAAQDTTVKLQNKDDPYYAIWQKIFAVSVAGMKKTYAHLGVHFDVWKGEAAVHDQIAPMVEDLKSRGLAVESDGAWVVPVAEDGDKKEMPPLILYKRDGAVMYGTTDMATCLDRMALYDPARMVYVVDQRQSLHFEQVFRAVRKGGIVPGDVELTHAGFGTMNGPDGKPFKTRTGGVMKLEDLITMAEDKARERLTEANLAADMDEGAREVIAHKVAMAAIKFADLQNARQADYTFDLDRLTSFEGKTGPYLLYQAVRITSLLGKAGLDMSAAPHGPARLVLEDADRPLALALSEWPDAFTAALHGYAPHHLCDYAYRLAQAFSTFYNACHILSEDNAALKASRLRLCAMTRGRLDVVLNLLGIDVPDRM